MTLIYAVVASIAAVLAMLLFLASFLMSGAFAGRVPGGSNAVGLVVPLFGSIAAALLLLLASGLTLSLQRLDWAGARSGAWVMLLSLGVGVAAVTALLAWMERLGTWVTPVGIIGGGLAPLLACGLLLLSLWAPERLTGADWPRLTGATLLLPALLGVFTAIALLADWWTLQQANVARAEITEMAEAAERSRRQDQSPLERLREDYASYAPDTPLWVFIAGLPDTDDPAERDFVIQRALKVPNFDNDLKRTITDRHPRYRHGAIELLLYVDARKLKPGWASLLAESIAISAKEIGARPNWMIADEQANPDPARHIRAMLAAAERLGATPALRAAVLALQQAQAAQASR